MSEPREGALREGGWPRRAGVARGASSLAEPGIAKLIASLLPQLPSFLDRQAWAARPAGDTTVPAVGDTGTEPLGVRDVQVLVPGRPGALALSVEREGVIYQVVLGLRNPGRGVIRAVGGAGDAVLGVVEDSLGEAVAYDALVDPGLCVQILKVVCDAELLVSRGLDLLGDQRGTKKRINVRVARARHSSTIVFDEKVMLKIYHRLSGGPNHDAEMILALDNAGFNHIAAPVAVWAIDGVDRGMVQECTGCGTEGRALAVTSLRDLYTSKCAPGVAGGDFASESERLGIMTARMHLALASAFGSSEGKPEEWASFIESSLLRRSPRVARRRKVAELLDRLKAMEHPGDAIRVHGDYHLGNVVRSEVGWFVADFEQLDTTEGLERPSGATSALTSSPILDIATMLRSFAGVARTAGDEHDPNNWAVLAPFARAWRERNSRAFLAGYMSTSGVERLLPGERNGIRLILRAMALG